MDEQELNDVMEIQRLMDENERLKGENENLMRELKQTEAQDQVVFDGLRKENAKLKCLSLHVMRDLFCVYMANEYFNLQDRKDEEGKARAKKLYEKFAHLRDKYREAYRKAKKELMDNHNKL